MPEINKPETGYSSGTGLWVLDYYPWRADSYPWLRKGAIDTGYDETNPPDPDYDENPPVGITDSPFWDSVDFVWNDLDYTWDEYIQNIYTELSRQSTNYTNIPKP